jgi:ATP-dependent RNA helicase DDX27
MIARPQTKFNIDFIPTISDSESDVPNLDSEDEVSIENDEEGTLTKSKVKKNNKKKEKNSKKKSTKQVDDGDIEDQKDDDKENQISKDLNPDFMFSVDDFGSTTTFDGWDFNVDEGKSKNVYDKKDVDLDEIIRRKGGLTGKIDTNNNEDTIGTEDEADQEITDGNNSDLNTEIDDDELAMDGFGMGVELEDTKKGNEGEESESASEAEDEDENTDSAESGQTLLDLGMIGDDSGEQNKHEDSADAIAKYYDEDEGQAAKNQAHQTFQSLQLSRPILKALAGLGYSKPTKIQSASIPIALLGRDIVAGAVTGSGKTAAYMTPVIERLLYKPAKIAKTRVIVLTPTRELAIQVADVGRKLGQYVHNLSFGLAVGGLNLRQQEQELKKRPDIVIATPGRLIDHIRNSPSFSVDDVEIVIMDEADRMLEEGFEKEMQEIVELLPRKRQTMLFSATMNSSIKQLIAWSLEKPVRIMVDPPKTAASNLVQEFIRVRKREELKPSLLYTILSKFDPKQRVIIFVSTKDMCHKVRIRLGLLGLRVGELHGGLSQEQRLKSVTLFKKSTVPVLLCTDLAARGLDIPKIEVVINFDMPKTYEIYLHRVGRTARAGRDGLSISFVGEAKKDRGIVREVIKNVEESNQGKAIGRNADWDEVDRVNKILDSKSDLIQEIIDEEKQEKAVLAAEMELKKGENMLKYKEEIESRPKRTWFMSEKEKKEDKNKMAETFNKTKKTLNSKKRKREEAMQDAGNSRSYKKTGSDRKSNDTKRINKLTSKKNGKRRKNNK